MIILKRGVSTSYRVTADEIGIWAMGDHSNAPDVAAQQGNLNKAASDLSRLRGIIFDLRSQTPSRPFTRGFASFFLNTTQVAQRLSSESYMTPAERIRTPGAFRIDDSRRVEPAAGARDMPVVFIINEHSDLPAEMFGLQTAGRARIVAEGEVTGRAITATSDIPLSDGLVAQIRVGELVFEQGVRPFHPDVLVPRPEKPADSDTALATAENLIRGFDSKALFRSYSPALGVARPDRPYADAPYPAPEVRLLAVFRLWGAINYLFPYRELITAQWDDVLKVAVQAVENADDALSYHLAIAAMAAHIGDSHGIIQSSILDEHFGTAAPPVRVRMIERLPVITGFRDEQAARDAGAEIGHVILSVDGEPVNDRVIRYAKYVASSTPQARLRDVLDRRSSTASTGGILYGPPQSTVTLVVRDRAGQRKTIALARRTEFRAVREQRSGEILRLLPNGIGYADLDRLTTSMIDQMFEKFRGTKGIVFDMRGYPRIDQADLAARLTDQKSVPGAIFETVVRMLPDNRSDITGRSTTDVAIQTFNGASSEPYRGRTVLLIDERTQSAAEHLGLFLKAANNTVFVGESHGGG